MILKMKYYSGRQVHNIITETIAGKTLADVLERFAKEPSADVQEVRHGRWLMTDAYPHRIYCSNCYGTYALDHWGIWIDGSLPRAYCPNCGAKMDEVERNEN